MMTKTQSEVQALHGERLEVILDLWGQTQKELSSQLGITQPALSKIIKRERGLSSDLAARACLQFDLPQSFFTVHPSRAYDGVVTFRKGSATTSKQGKRVTRLVKEAARVWAELSRMSGYREAFLPSPAASTEENARQIRADSGLSDNEPVRNMVRLLERLGIGVITQLDPNNTETESPAKTHTGASMPSTEITRPVITLVNKLPGGVARLTLAHELGHLIYDQDRTSQIQGTRSPEEQRAFDFSMRLLMPHAVLKEHINERTPLRQYLDLKAQYGVNVSALITHAKQTKLISPTRERSLYIQMSAAGWRSHEPVNIPVEDALLMRQAAQQIWSVNTAAEAANSLGVPKALLEGWLRLEPAFSGSGKVLNLDSYRQLRGQRQQHVRRSGSC